MGDNYYKTNSMLEKKLHEEIERFRQINRYAKKLMNEQEVPDLPADIPPAPGGDVPPAPGGDLPPAPGGDVPPAPGGDLPPAPGGELDMGATPEGDTEEIDITDLVNMTKSIKKELDSKKESSGDVNSKMNDVFTKLDDLEKKLSNMDNIINKIEELGSKVENMRPKSPQEKLELRSLDSYPFNQNPQQFFANKQDEMMQSGKNEYVLTKDEIQNYSKDTIRDTFNSDLQDEDEFTFNR
jgi:hypothetical protein